MYTLTHLASASTMDTMAKWYCKGWWDLVLDGKPHTLELEYVGLASLSDLRNACYRMASARSCHISTHKVTLTVLAIQAWGNPRIPGQLPYEPDPLRATIMLHPETVVPLPDPLDWCRQERARAAQALMVRERAAFDAEADLLLGPCTCGEAPVCTPVCARNVTVEPVVVDTSPWDAVMVPVSDPVAVPPPAEPAV